MGLVALPFLAAFLAALAGLLGWPLALGLMPTMAGWLRWPGLDVVHARRGRRWGLWGYLSMVGLVSMQVGLFWLGLSLEEWDGEKLAIVMIPMVGYTATVGLAVATVVGAVLGCFAGGTKGENP